MTASGCLQDPLLVRADLASFVLVLSYNIIRSTRWAMIVETKTYNPFCEGNERGAELWMIGPSEDDRYEIGDDRQQFQVVLGPQHHRLCLQGIATARIGICWIYAVIH